MEDKLYDALARVLLANPTDEWGNKVDSPLTKAIRTWAEERKQDIAAQVIKNIGIDILAEKVSDNVISQLQSRQWSTEYERENLKKLVMEKLAQKLADRELEKLNKDVTPDLTNQLN